MMGVKCQYSYIIQYTVTANPHGAYSHRLDSDIVQKVHCLSGVDLVDHGHCESDHYSWSSR